jgi:hypothetical protein
MSLTFVCPHCGQDIIVRYLKVGEEAACPHCRQMSVVPSTAAVTSAEPSYHTGTSQRSSQVNFRAGSDTSEVRDAGWGLWVIWLLATFLGWFVGFSVGFELGHITPEEVNPIVLFGPVLGAGVGLAQMIAVRRVLPLTQRWVWGAAVGMGTPFIVAGVIPGVDLGFDLWRVPVAAAGGALAGLIQAPTLRRHTPRAQWWVLASLVSWGIAFWLSIVPSVSDGPGILFVGGAALGVVSGALLIWIVRSSPGHETV